MRSPRASAIVGGGVVGVEMATAYASLGSQVTVISRGALIETMEPFAGQLVMESLRHMGVEVLIDTGTVSVTRSADGVSIGVGVGDGEMVLSDEILVAVGRVPRTHDLGLDDTLLVPGFDWLYAVDYDLGRVAGASVYADGYAGMARMVVDESRGVLLGVTFVGSGVSEMLQAATIAIVGEVPLERLWHAVPAYPMISEVWLRLLETYGRPA